MDIRSETGKIPDVRIHTVTGRVSVDGLLLFLGNLYAADEFDPKLNVIWDFRAADLGSFSLSEVISVRDFIENSLIKPTPRRAAIVVSKQVDYSLTAMFETLLQRPGSKARTFFSFEEAERWVSKCEIGF